MSGSPHSSKMTKRIAFLSILGLGGVHSTPSLAQVFDMGSLTATLSVDHVTQSESARAAGLKSADLSLITMKQITEPSSSLSHQPAETGFKFSQKNRTENLQRIVKTAAKTDPVGAKAMADIFAKTDLIGEIGKAIAPLGLRTDNVADAYTVYWMTSWQAAHGDTSDFSATKVAAVRRQSANILMSASPFVSSANSVRQEMAEIYLIQAALIDAVASDANLNPSARSNLAKAVIKGARASGLDLTKMTLTEDGFVPRSGGRSDASDGAGGEQLAANDSGTAADDASLGHYALYAAAGTGLLAGVFALGKGLSKRG